MILKKKIKETRQILAYKKKQDKYLFGVFKDLNSLFGANDGIMDCM